MRLQLSSSLRLPNVKFLKLFLGLACFFCLNPLISQEAYRIDWQKEWKYLGALAGANALGYGLFLGTEQMSYEQWLLLDASRINSLDRTSLLRNSNGADNWSDILSNGSLALPLLVYLSKGWDPKWWESSIMFFEVIALNGSLIHLSKYGIRRPRPYVYGLDFQEGDRLGRSDVASFVSGHTSFAAGNCFFAAAIFQRAYPDSPLVPWAYVTAAAIPAITGIQRIEAGKHFPTDVIAGYLLGTLAATAVIQVHQRDDLQLQMGSGQVGLVFRF